MPSVRFPINVNLESIDGDVDRGKISNGYAEAISQQEVKVYSRPALTLAQGSFAAFGQGMAYTPVGQLFVISGGEVYSPVGGVSASAVNTLTAGNDALFRTKGNYIYAIGKGANGPVLRAASPYTSFSTIGSHGAASIADGIVYNNAFFVIDSAGTGGIFRSADGIAWTTLAQGPTGVARFFSFGGTLGIYPITLSNGAAYSYNLSGGTGTWTDGAFVMGTGISARGWIHGTHGGKLWTVAGTGVDDVNSSSDIVNWTSVNAAPGWTAQAGGYDFGSVFASLGNTMYTAVYTAGGTYQIWSSENAGVTWTLGATITPSSSDTLVQLISAGGSVYAALSNSSGVYILYKVSGDGTLENITPLTTVEVADTELVSIAGNTAVTFFKTSNAAYTISSGTVTQVSDAQYPAETVRGAVYLNGRLYVMEPDGTIWNSAEDDFTSWAGTDFISAEFEADEGVCLAKQGEYVVALGQFTTEAFYDAANATGSPLAPVSNAVMLIGCAHANSVAQAENLLMWVAQQKGEGSTFNKGRFVVAMQGYGNYQRISTPDVERVLDADDFSGVYAAVLTIAGHVFYVISLLDTDVTLAYDFRSQLWYEWTLATVGSAKSVSSLTQSNGLATATSTSHGFSDGDQVTIAGAGQAGYNLTVNINVTDANTFTYPVDSATVSPATGTITATGYTYGALDISASCYFNNEQLVQLRTTGDVYVLDVTGTSDNGTPIDFRIRTRSWDAGTNREKFMGALDVVGDKVSSTGLVRYSDDDFQSYTPFKRVDLSLRRPRSRRGGSFSSRAVEFRHTLSAKVGISALEGEIEMGEQ